MSSSSKPVIVALVATVTIVSAILVGALFLMLGDDPGRDFGQGPDLPSTPEGPSVITPDLGDDKPSIIIPTDKNLQILTVRVIEKSNSRLIRGSSIIVKKAVDSDQVGETVYPTSSTPTRTSKGEFTVSLVPGAYTVRARAHSYASKRVSVALIVGQENQTLEIPLERGLSITGRVTDMARHPIAGARVVAYEELGAPDDDPISQLINMVGIMEKIQEPSIETVSEPDGTYQLDGLNKAHYTVHAYAKGYAPAGRANVRPSARNVDLRLPEGSEFFGMVVDDQNNAVSGAQVRVFPEVDSQDIFAVIEAKSRPAIETVETDSSGQFKLTTLGTAIYNLIVTAPGYQPGRFKKIAVYQGKNESKTFTLKPGLLLAGEVVGPDGEPIAGAFIRPIRTGDVRDQNINITSDDGRIETNAEGLFEFNTLESGKYSLLAWHDDYAAKQLRNVELGNMSLRITLSRGGAVSGRIIEATTGEPVVGARVVISDLLDLKKPGLSDENGEYYIGAISPAKRGKQFISVQAEGFARVGNKQVRIEEGKITESQDFELQQTAQIVGLVVNSNGDPVQRARVMAKRRGANTVVPLTVGSAETDADGRYSIDSLEAGQVTWLTVWHQEYLEVESGSFDIEPGEQLEIDTLTLTLGGSVTGVVVDPSGSGVYGAQISVRAEGETNFSPIKSTSTDRRGRFKILGLVAGLIDLNVKSVNYLEEIVEGVEIKEGEITPEIRIQVRTGNRLGGLVVGSQNKPVLAARVIVREYATGVKEHRGETNAQGRFEFKNLIGQEPVEIEIEHPDYSPYINEKVEISAEDLTIQLDPLGGISGVVVNLSGEPMASFVVQPKAQLGGGAVASSSRKIAARTFQNQQGTFEFLGIPAGTYSVAINAPSFAAVTINDVVVRNGEISDIGQAQLQEGGLVDGQVINAQNRQPISGVRLRVQGGSGKFLPSSKGSPRTTGSIGTTFTDESGFFQFKNLRAGKLTLIVKHNAYVATNVTDIDPNDASTSRGIQIALDKGGEVTGIVLNADGSPRKGISVFLTGLRELAKEASVNQRTTSDTSGRFSFSSIRPGGYRVTAHDFKIKGPKPSVDIEVQSGAGVVDVRLVLEQQ